MRIVHTNFEVLQRQRRWQDPHRSRAYQEDAETVLEPAQRESLFQITCGDLGTTAHEVEKELKRNFALASRWGCVLLLDEADVFLAQRERKDFVRNGLVAVFLRVLEYYAGIMFLTKNRVGDFDEAFASRTYISLYYPELNREQTKKIFKLDLELIEGRFKAQNRKLEFDDSAILSFAKQHYDEYKHARWNGQQIRNASQTALALAEFDAQNKSLALDINNSVEVHLKQGHFAIVQKAYLAFSKYLGDVFGTEGDKRAEENQPRARAEELHRSSKSHRKENSQSKYHDTEFQLTNQHINDMYQGNGYPPAHAWGPSPYRQMGHAPTRYGPGGSFGGGQQEPYGHDQPTRLPPSNTPYNQPSIIHDSLEDNNNQIPFRGKDGSKQPPSLNHSRLCIISIIFKRRIERMLKYHLGVPNIASFKNIKDSSIFLIF
ncbi:hypothetical protein EYC80_002194 [Monilinia laxa]|uniref:Uncharacterized protein n=1 Tax=Monilinia laxa TaxID=61186 RepID=A0A5N6K370_MONLA|nr:hypothetical protein EYC80_002194 [Monilinia laxa]